MAVDAEVRAQRVPAVLTRRFPEEAADFWRFWTAAEVVAKLTDEPILLVVRRDRQGLVAPGLRLKTLHVDDLTVTAGWLE